MREDGSDLFDLLEEISSLVTKEWPKELPPKDAPGFWEMATRQEFAHRATLTQKIRLALSGERQSAASWSPIEAWLYARRREYAIQRFLEGLRQGLTYSGSPRNFLMELMADRWHENGAIAFWNHAMERDGQPHPELDEDILKMMS